MRLIYNAQTRELLGQIESDDSQIFTTQSVFGPASAEDCTAKIAELGLRQTEASEAPPMVESRRMAHAPKNPNL